MTPDYERCIYRRCLAKCFDIHISCEDCDKYGTERCECTNGKEAEHG
nr:MAG TPA_asm: hypothetical protein [Caudoviricetes sp.]